MPILTDKTTFFTSYYDANKTMQLDMSGVTTGSRHFLKVPDKSGTIALVGPTPEVLVTYFAKTTSIAPTILWKDAPTGIYVLQATVTKFSGAGSISVTPTWDGGTKDENLITSFS